MADGNSPRPCQGVVNIDNRRVLLRGSCACFRTGPIAIPGRDREVGRAELRGAVRHPQLVAPG